MKKIRLEEYKIFWPVVILLLAQTICSSEVFWIIGAAICIVKIIINKGKVLIPFYEYKLLLIFVLWGVLSAAINSIASHNLQLIDVIRDIFYYFNPIIFIYLGAIWAREKVDIYSILNAFIVFTGINAVIALINALQNLSLILNISYVGDWRSEIGNGDTTLAISLALFFSGIIPKEKRINKYIYYFIAFICCGYFVLTLSRTVLLAFIILFLSIVWKKGNVKTLKKLIGISFALIIIMIVAFLLLPDTITRQFLDKLYSSISEISFVHSWNTVAEIQSNWRGYETYCALKQLENSNLFEVLFGSGFGERIYVGEYAYLFLDQVDSLGRLLDSLAVLHNGYATQIVKLGIVGLFFYILFYILIIRRGYYANKQVGGLDARLLMGIGIELLVQTYFLNGLFKDVCFFALVIMIGYTGYTCRQYKLEQKILVIEKS